MVVAVALLTASSAAAQESPAPTQLEPVVVTPTRLEQQAGEAPASVTVITREDVRQSASQTVDDLLRQVPGFSLFRRTSSLVGHPTTQGLSLRGIGPSGTSRALVPLGRVPINDPFGGWVYWNRIPLQAIDPIDAAQRVVAPHARSTAMDDLDLLDGSEGRAVPVHAAPGPAVDRAARAQHGGAAPAGRADP